MSQNQRRRCCFAERIVNRRFASRLGSLLDSVGGAAVDDHEDG
jgi:hypothetical protein